MTDEYDSPQLNCCECGNKIDTNIVITNDENTDPVSRTCVDTISWRSSKETGIKTCKSYARDHCENGVLNGNSGGAAHNSPELNCCQCGKPADQTSCFCKDTLDWKSKGGKNCYQYQEFCIGKNPLSAHLDKFGEAENLPEENCCACGKNTC
jgi:hypothetical protein